MNLPVLCAPPGDNVSSTLTAPFNPASSTTIAIQPGDIARFGVPTPIVPIRVRLVRQSQLVAGIWAVADPTQAATFRVTGVAGSTLTGATFESGTSQTFAAGDLVAVAVTARDFTDLQAYARGAGRVNLLTAGAAIGVTVVGDGITDDQPAIQAIADANPGRILYAQRTVTAAQFAASGGYRPSYYMGNTLTLTPGAGVIGDGGQGAPWTFRFAPGKAGIRMANGCVVGDLNILGSEAWIGTNFWEGIVPALRYPGLSVAAGASAADGIQVAGLSCRLFNLVISSFGRDGINGCAQELGTIGPEDSVFDGPFYFVNNRGHGIYIQGGDGNCCILSGVSVNVNQFWGINSDAFLATTIIAPQADQNGTDGAQNLTSFELASVPVASLTRSANVVTAVFAVPVYANDLGATLMVPGNGMRILTCTDASFLGRWRVLTVSADSKTFTWTQIAPNATVNGGSTARANGLPPDYVIATATRAANVVTLTATVPMVVGPAGASAGVASNGFQVGQGVSLLNCPDLTFNGTFIVLSVSLDKKTVTYAQTAANATIASGTVRMALPGDTWALKTVPVAGTHPEALFGGSYRSTVATNNSVWVQPYAEGGQALNLGQNCLVLNPTWTNTPDPSNTNDGGYCTILYSTNAALNRPISLDIPYDGNVIANEAVGSTANYNVLTRTLDRATSLRLWEHSRGPTGWLLRRGNADAGNAPIRIGADFTAATGNGDTNINSDGTGIVLCNVISGTGTGGFAVGVGTGGSPTTRVYGGQMVMIPIADATALNGALFLGSDHAGKPCWKDAGGVVHTLNMTP